MDENNIDYKDEDNALQGVSITSMDILQQKFSVRFRGYNVQDVDAFLEVVAKEIEGLTNENAGMHEELLTLRKELRQYKKKEESINAALVTVQKMAEDVKNNAANEAEELVSNARQEAEQMMSEARHESEGAIDNAERKTSEAHDEINCRKLDAEAEAARIIEEARSDARRTREDLDRDRARIEQEITLLQQRKMQFQISLRTLLETHTRLLDSEKDS
jgi:cell division initiation protein